jgi:hypothetical protein
LNLLWFGRFWWSVLFLNLNRRATHAIQSIKLLNHDSMLIVCDSYVLQEGPHYFWSTPSKVLELVALIEKECGKDEIYELRVNTYIEASLNFRTFEASIFNIML